MATSNNYPLLSVIGIEIEYMLVNKESLNVWPHSDLILSAFSDTFPCNEVALDNICLSNELVMHVLELKNNGPQPPTYALVQAFQDAILKIQPVLERHNVCLMPSGAHPWMDPERETRRWPYGNHAIYQQYDSIFNCKGHGWSNLQSMHINLPFSTTAEFARLHHAIRLLLPILPAISASSPILDAKKTGFLDTRLHFYEINQSKIPSISGEIIPEEVSSEHEYKELILNPMYQAIAPFDPEQHLQEEWLNSRGAIPKFEYGAIEIRILDTQECVLADLSIARVIYQLLAQMVNENADYSVISTPILKQIYDQTLKRGLDTLITENAYLDQWSLPHRTISLRDLWTHLLERVQSTLLPAEYHTFNTLLDQGNLSQRILKTFNPQHAKASLYQTYGALCQCLLTNTLFLP